MERLQSKSIGRHGFTMIELIIVISIIATLIAILFPVLATARDKARTIACISNLRQLGLAYSQYVSDFDETTPHMEMDTIPGGIDGSGIVPKWYIPLEAYIQSQQMLLCPDRTDTFNPVGNGLGSSIGPDTDGCYDNWNTTGTCFGYGYNDGLVSDTGYGLLNSQIDHPVKLRPGRNISQIANPSETFAFGDTNDRPGYSISLDNDASSLPPLANSSMLRHGGRYNIAFVDGHVKSIKYVTATYPEFGELSIPTSKNDAYDYCFDRSSKFVPDPLGHFAAKALPANYPLQSHTETCSQAIDDIYSNVVVNP